MLNTHMRRKGGAGCSPGLLCTTPPSVSQEQDMPGPKITLIPGHFSANSLSFTLAISDRTPRQYPPRKISPSRTRWIIITGWMTSDEPMNCLNIKDALVFWGETLEYHWRRSVFFMGKFSFKKTTSWGDMTLGSPPLTSKLSAEVATFNIDWCGGLLVNLL